jgi:YD repeat-containing protein
MEQNCSKTRRPAKKVARVSSRKHRCSHGATMTAPIEGAIVVEPGAAPMAETPSHARVEVLESYFGADGKPIKRKSLGAARVARRYDERGNQVEEAYFNAEGKPTMCKDLGAARIAWRYDESGNRTEEAFFGADGAPIAQPIAHGGAGRARKAPLKNA